MKKKNVLLLVFLLFLSGCRKTPLPLPFETQKTFSAHTEAETGQKRFGAELTCRENGNISVTFTAPDALSGFAVTTAGGVFRVTLDGLEDTIPCGELPEDSPLRLLTEALREAVFSDSRNVTRAGGTYTSSRTVGGRETKAVFSSDGYIQSLECPDTGFSAVFFYDSAENIS